MLQEASLWSLAPKNWSVCSTKPQWRDVVSSQWAQLYKRGYEHVVLGMVRHDIAGLTSARIWCPMQLAWTTSQTLLYTLSVSDQCTWFQHYHQQEFHSSHANSMHTLSWHSCDHRVDRNVTVLVHHHPFTVMAVNCDALVRLRSSAADHNIQVFHISCSTSKPETSCQAPNSTNQQ